MDQVALAQANFNPEIIKFLGSVAAFTFAFWQYKTAQRRKQKEFVSLQMEKFFQNQDVILSLQMLDWLERPLTLKSGLTYEFTHRSLKKILASEDCDFASSLVQYFARYLVHPTGLILHIENSDAKC